MRFKYTGKGKDDVLVVIKNAETSIAIKSGAPVFLALNGSEDGLQVTSVEAIGEWQYNLFYGFSIQDILPGAVGEALVFGFCPTIRMLLNTRAAITDDWLSYPAGNTGDILFPVTGPNIQAMSVFSSGQYTQSPFFAALAQSYASGSSTAGDTSTDNTDTRTAILTNLKAFVRAL